MSAPTKADPLAWVPVPVRWRHVVPGDVLVGTGDTPGLLPVAGSTPSPGGGQWRIQLAGAPTPFDGDPDTIAQVLVSVPERDALTVARDLLGTTITERRGA